MADHIGVHGDAVVGDRGGDDGILHDRGLRAGRVPLANRLAGACPCELPFGHLRGIGHDGGDGGEVDTQALAVPKCRRGGHEAICPYLLGNLAKDRVGRDGEGSVERDVSVPDFIHAHNVCTTDFEAPGAVVGGLERCDTVLERRRQRDRLERGARGVESLRSAVEHGGIGTAAGVGGLDGRLDIRIVVRRGARPGQDGARAGVEHDDGSLAPGECLLSGDLDTRVYRELHGVAGLRNAGEGVEGVLPAWAARLPLG